MAEKSQLEKLRDYLSNTADPETRREIAEKLSDPESDIALAMQLVRESAQEWGPVLEEALRRQKEKNKG